MGAATTERRVMHLQNHVLAQRSRSPTAQGKIKKWHPTKKHLGASVSSVVRAVETYPADLEQAVAKLPTACHQPPDFASHLQKNAAKAHPEKRKQYDVVHEADVLVVPLKGKVHQEANGGR